MKNFLTYNCDDQSWLHIFLRKFMIFHIFIGIRHLLWVYYELTMWPAPSCLDSWVGRGTAPVSKRSWVESRSGLNFFQALISWLLKGSVSPTQLCGHFLLVWSFCISCDDQTCLHIFLSSLNIWSFIYSFAKLKFTLPMNLFFFL